MGNIAAGLFGICMMALCLFFGWVFVFGGEPQSMLYMQCVGGVIIGCSVGCLALAVDLFSDFRLLE